MQKQSVKWGPKCLNSNQKQYQVNILKLILQCFQQLNIFFRMIVTVDKIELHPNNLETKELSMQWQ